MQIKYGIEIVGDIPIFVSYDSSNVWSHQKYFKLKDDVSKDKVTGAPLDYYSKEGQLWENPSYDWTTMKKDNYEWWVNRIKFLSNYVDIIRIDHFRGFSESWEIDAREITAINGKWVKSLGKDFFKFISKKFAKYCNMGRRSWK